MISDQPSYDISDIVIQGKLTMLYIPEDDSMRRLTDKNVKHLCFAYLTDLTKMSKRYGRHCDPKYK